MTTQTDGPSAGPDGGITDDAQAKIEEMAGRVQDQAQEALGQGQDRVREQVNQRSEQFGQQITEQAADLRSVSDALRDQGKSAPAELADRIAGYADRAGSYLSKSDADTLLSDAEQFGRERPGTVAVGAVAVGFAAARFLKASSRDRYTSRPRASAPQPRTETETPSENHQPSPGEITPGAPQTSYTGLPDSDSSASAPGI